MPDELPAPVAVVTEAIERLLAAIGPLIPEQLLDAVSAAGVALGGDPEMLLEDLLDSADLPLVLPLLDGRVMLLSALLDGRVFTHRVQAGELEYDLIAIDPDLSPVSMLTEADRYGRLIDGSPLLEVLPGFDADLLAGRSIPDVAVPVDGAFLLAPGTLRALGVSAGDVIGFRVTADGFGIERIDEAAEPPPDLGARLAAILEDRAHEGTDQLDTVLWTACAGDGELFRIPLPPLGQLLDAFDLPHQGDQIATVGFDFAAWRVQGRIERVAQLHGLDEDEALAVLGIVTLFEQVAELYDTAAAAREDGGPDELGRLYAALQTMPLSTDADGGAGAGELSDTTAAGPGREQVRQGTVRATLGFLAEPAVAEAVLAEAIGAGREQAGALGLFAETWEPMAPRSARPALRWLRAKAYERIGDTTRAEATLGEAEGLDPGWPLTLWDLARYASDRGDADRGLALLRRAGAPRDDPLMEVLQHFRATPRTDLGRNQPCWCGSGRKYKQCHLRGEQLPLAERAAWLYQKAGMWLVDGPWREEVLEVARERARYWDRPEALIAACQEGLVLDAVLFEGGAFAEFLTERGALLPEDERLLAEQWLLMDRSIFEIQAVQPGHGLTVRDVRTGDQHDVTEKTASRQLKPGTLVCTRIVTAGDTMQSFGGIEPVELHQRDELIALLDSAPDPAELVGFLSRRFAPPQLCNTEGDPLVACEATLRITDPAALTAVLDDGYDRDQDGERDGEPRWFEHVTTHGMERIRATLRLAGDEMHVQTNSEARLDRVVAALRRAQPNVTVIGESRTPAGELQESSRGPGLPAGENLIDSTDPQIVALLEQMTHQYEQSWLDESIPALAGNTPRQAAADPTRRPDLIRLLDSFPDDQGGPGTMNPGRLRTALGLA